VVQILRLRQALRDYAEGQVHGAGEAFAKFCAGAALPEAVHIGALSRVVKRVRDMSLILLIFAPLIACMRFYALVLLDGRISWLLLPEPTPASLCQTGLFEADNFRRDRADVQAEMFMPQPLDLHFHFNRTHSLFMGNIRFASARLTARPKVPQARPVRI
jgi:hypothetical protein